MRKIFLFVILILISILSLTASLDSGKMPLGTEPIRRGIKNIKSKRRILMKKQKQIRSNWMFCICAAITASAGWLGLVNTKPVLAAESVGEEIVMSDAAAAADIDAAGELSENSWGGGK